MKKILGLDLGTNSVGWALIEHDFDNKHGKILGLGSRIIPMEKETIGNFESGITGQSLTAAAERTNYRSVRRLRQRELLRRERLHRVLNILRFLPLHYAEAIDFQLKKGQFLPQAEGNEIKLNYEPIWDSSLNKFKHKFLFQTSFNEMINEFSKNGIHAKAPYDWTIYYLRKKALTQKITKEELSWILLNFNQKRGYYQLRGEIDDEETKNQTYEVLKVSHVVLTGEVIKKTGDPLYDIYFANDWKYDRQTTKPKEWLGKEKEFIVSTSILKNGDLKRSYKIVDSAKDWLAIKSKTEQIIINSDKTVGEYIFDSLLANPNQKIRGKLVRTIERKFYKAELLRIIKTQRNFHSELVDFELFQSCVKELYPKNELHQKALLGKDITHLFVNDIIFYQRPLKSKKSTINNCAFETRAFLKPNRSVQFPENEGAEFIKVVNGIKSTAKSNPYFQEFRLWQFLSNLRIYKKGTKDDEDVTQEMFPDEESIVLLFDFLNLRNSVEQKHIIDYLVKNNQIKKIDKDSFRWNYVEDKSYPCNETRALFSTRFNKIEGFAGYYFDKKTENAFWHLVYSVTDKQEFEKALKSFAIKHNFPEMSFVDNFKSIPPFKSDYAAFSEKAIKKLLPFMRMGKYWKMEDFHPTTYGRIDKLINGEFDVNISDRVWEKASGLKQLEDFKGLPLWLASYIVYDRHSENNDEDKWKTPLDVENFLSNFKQHSLRNPIVEQVVKETLKTVVNVWNTYGKGQENYFDEIHIELGRELKNPADIRKRIASKNFENENTNVRIRELLKELSDDQNLTAEVRPYSPSHQEILKIFEDGLINNPNSDYSNVTSEEIEKIRRNSSPSKSDIRKYKLWLEQGYISPYTGQVIRLSDLFSYKYQIEHIIPQARYFDDSFSNKVICESEVNQLKGNKTAYEFIKSEKGRVVELSGGKKVTLFTVEAYEAHCSQYFKTNRTKLKNLLSEEIPEGFINRQLNDSRYISKLIKELLNNLVKDEKDKDFMSPKIVPAVGSITSKLKKDWGLNDKWNELVSTRFYRMNELSKTSDYGFYDTQIHAFRCDVPDDQKGRFNIKRIDHRHHALDALIIACTNREHINYLNSIESKSENFALRSKLLVKNEHGHFTKTMLIPWQGFSMDALNALKTTVASFKQNNRVINKSNNRTWQWVLENGRFVKKQISQSKGDNFAIRKPLHKEKYSGKVAVRQVKVVSFLNGLKDWKNLRDMNLKDLIKSLYANGLDVKAVESYFKKKPYLVEGQEIKSVEVYTFTTNATASRIQLTENFTSKQLESLTDSGIKKILMNHLSFYDSEVETEKFQKAFSPDGIEKLNNNIIELNGGKFHQPIYFVRIFEEGSKFPLSDSGQKSTRYVEAAKGTNLFFAVYWNENKRKREFGTIPLNEVIAYQKQQVGEPNRKNDAIPVDSLKGEFLFSLSPNDLVYVPSEIELEQPSLVNFSSLSTEQYDRIFKVVSCTGSRCYFIPSNIATSIVDKAEFTSLNKIERDLKGIMIKEVCWKLYVNKLGQIVGSIR